MPVPIATVSRSGNALDGTTLGMREPLLAGARERRARASHGQRVLELLSGARLHRVAYGVPFCGDAELGERSPEVVREVGVELYEPVVAGSVEAAERVPDLSRPFAVDAQELLAAERRHHLVDLDAHGLLFAGPYLPDLRGRDRRDTDRRGRHRTDRIRRRQRRISPDDLDVVERARRAAERIPCALQRGAGSDRRHGRVVTSARAHA